MGLYSEKFDIHGVIVEVATDASETGELISDYLSYYKTENNPDTHISFKLEMYRPAIIELPSEAKWFFNYHNLSGFVHDGIYYYVSSPSVLIFDPSKLCVEGLITEELIRQGRIFTHGLFSIVLMEVLRYRGLFYLHGAALESPDGISLLVTGESKAGKTTLTVGLICNGWKWLTDDTLFLRDNANELELLPFKRPFHIPLDLAEKVEELRFLRDTPEYFPNTSKRAFKAEEIYGHLSLAFLNRPDVVLFSSIVDFPESRLEPMTALVGVNEIIRNSPYVLFSHEPAGKHLDALKSVVQGASCYRFFAGKDMADDPVETVAKISKLLT